MKASEDLLSRLYENTPLLKNTPLLPKGCDWKPKPGSSKRDAILDPSQAPGIYIYISFASHSTSPDSSAAEKYKSYICLQLYIKTYRWDNCLYPRDLYACMIIYDMHIPTFLHFFAISNTQPYPSNHPNRAAGFLQQPSHATLLTTIVRTRVLPVPSIAVWLIPMLHGKCSDIYPLSEPNGSQW